MKTRTRLSRVTREKNDHRKDFIRSIVKTVQMYFSREKKLDQLCTKRFLVVVDVRFFPSRVGTTPVPLKKSNPSNLFGNPSAVGFAFESLMRSAANSSTNEQKFFRSTGGMNEQKTDRPMICCTGKHIDRLGFLYG